MIQSATCLYVKYLNVSWSLKVLVLVSFKRTREWEGAFAHLASCSGVCAARPCSRVGLSTGRLTRGINWEPNAAWLVVARGVRSTRVRAEGSACVSPGLFDDWDGAQGGKIPSRFERWLPCASREVGCYSSLMYSGWRNPRHQKKKKNKRVRVVFWGISSEISHWKGEVKQLHNNNASHSMSNMNKPVPD